MNTEKAYWNAEGYRDIPGMEVHHLTKEEFDHGGTRNLAAWYSESDIMIFMTDDAVPQDEHLIENLLKGLDQKGPEGETVAVAYAKQLPAKDCHTIERYTRSFNYPDTSMIKTKKIWKPWDQDLLCVQCLLRVSQRHFPQAGRVCEQYQFFNEDMIYAATAMEAGYAVAYVPDAKVIHSHNLTPMQQFHRNFDLAVSQAEHPEIFADLKSEGEGIRLVKQTAKYLLTHLRGYLIPELVVSSGCKYLGYKLGRQYEKSSEEDDPLVQHEPALLGKEMEKKIMMTTTLRIALILVSLGTFAMIMRKIRQSRMQIESAIFWIVLALVLVVYSVFPKVADACAGLLGIYATTNFLFLFAIFVLILKVFFMSIHISQLESKIRNWFR